MNIAPPPALYPGLPVPTALLLSVNVVSSILKSTPSNWIAPPEYALLATKLDSEMSISPSSA